MERTEDLRKLKLDLAMVARDVYRRGLQTGNGGNLSARLPGTETMIIKASGCSFAECDENSWIVCDLDGNVLEGNGSPSSEYPVHAAIYKKSPRVNCNVHVHDPFMIAIAELYDDSVPMYAHHVSMKLGSRIPILDIETPGITQADMWRVEALFDEMPTLGGFLHKKHGGFALGSSCAKGLYNAELINEACRTAFYMYLAQK